jgi:hypothetical protein
LPKGSTGPANRQRVGITVALFPTGVCGAHKFDEVRRVNPGDGIETEFLRFNDFAKFHIGDPLHDVVHTLRALERGDKPAVNQLVLAEVQMVII